MKSVLRLIGAGLLSTGVLLGAGQAEALDPPHSYKFSKRLDHKQAGYTQVKVNKDGVATILTKFSNGKQWDGDHFLALIVFSDESGNPIAAVKQRMGLDGSYGGSARSDRVTKELKLTKAQWARVKTIKVTMKHYDKVDDRKAWEALRKVVEAFVAGGDNGDRKIAPPRGSWLERHHRHL